MPEPISKKVAGGSTTIEKMVSIIIPVYDQWRYTHECLSSLETNTSREQFELIIVNNASTDETLSRLSNEYAHLVDRRIDNPSNLGVAKAWNQGIIAATGDYICIINNDILLYPKWLDWLLMGIQSNKQFWCVTPESGIPPMLPPANIPVEYPDLVVHYPAGIRGWCFLVSRIGMQRLYEFEASVWAQNPLSPLGEPNPYGIALFDEQFEMAWYEDSDFLNRLYNASHPPAMIANSYIYHYESRTLVPNMSNLTRYIHANAERYRIKWSAK